MLAVYDVYDHVRDGDQIFQLRRKCTALRENPGYAYESIALVVATENEEKTHASETQKKLAIKLQNPCLVTFYAVSYTHLTLPTIYSV